MCEQYNSITKLRINTKSENYKKSSGKYLPVIKTIVQNIDLHYVRPQRAGVIMYTTVNGAAYFGLGIDSKSHD